jgi:antitoxin component HigA of HigAB toxin-antitoxin module
VTVDAREDAMKIRTEADYAAALARIDALMDAAPGSPEGEELDVLADLVENYEEKHVPMGERRSNSSRRLRRMEAQIGACNASRPSLSSLLP